MLFSFFALSPCARSIHLCSMNDYGGGSAPFCTACFRLASLLVRTEHTFAYLARAPPRGTHCRALCCPLHNHRSNRHPVRSPLLCRHSTQGVPYFLTPSCCSIGNQEKDEGMYLRVKQGRRKGETAKRKKVRKRGEEKEKGMCCTIGTPMLQWPGDCWLHPLCFILIPPHIKQSTTTI